MHDLQVGGISGGNETEIMKCSAGGGELGPGLIEPPALGLA